MKKILVLAGVLALAWAATAMALNQGAQLRSKPVMMTGDENVQLKLPRGPLPKPFLLSPGYGVGISTYDWMKNGAMGKAICRDAQKGTHLYWTYRLGSDQNSRRGYYNFKDETGAWAFGHDGTAHDSRVGRMGGMTILADGRGVPTSHIGGGPITGVSVDAARGAGAFTTYIPDSTNPTKPYWPQIYTGASDVIHTFACTQSSDTNFYYSRSTNSGATWSTWLNLTGGVGTLGGGWFAGAASGQKVALIWPDNFNYDVWVRESTNNGTSWGSATRIFQWQSGVDTVVGCWLWCDGLYDAAGNLHVVTNMVDSAFVEGITGRRGFKSVIGHWSQATGWTVVRSGWWGSGPGGNHSTVACPQLGLNPANNQLWCTWVEFTLADTSTEGFANGEVWAAYSANNGATWGGARNLTNSPTPGAPPGACADDRYSSLAALVDDTLHVNFLSSFAAGSALQDGSTLTTDTVRCLQRPAVGVEEEAKGTIVPSAFALAAARPNPTGKATAIEYSLPYAGEAKLAVYNAAGQLVKTLASGTQTAGVHAVRWDASRVPAGVYFFRLTAGGFTQTRTMVVVR